ncbi:MAG: hypothetical protein ACKVS6_05265, partial [Planctomycetota bacterium]
MIADRRANASRGIRKRKRSRVFYILFFVTFALAFGTTLRFSVAPAGGRIAKIVSEQIQQYFTPKVSVGDVRFEPLGPAVTLSRIIIGDGAEPDVTIAKARVEFKFESLQNIKVTKIILDEPVLREESIARLFKTSEAAPPAELPQFFIRRGRLLVHLPEVGRFEFFELLASATPREGGELALAGTARIPLRGSVRVGGNIHLKTGAFDLRAETDSPIELQALTSEAISKDIQYWRDQLKLEGQLQFFAQAARESAAAPLITIFELEGSGVRCTGPNLNINETPVDLREVEATDFKIAATLDRGGLARVSAQGRVLGSENFEVLCEAQLNTNDRTLTTIRGGFRARELMLGPNVQKLLDRIDDGPADVVRGLHPEGPADISGGFSYDTKTAKLDMQCDIDFAPGPSVTFLGFQAIDKSVDASFPYTITGLSGRISWRPEVVIVAGVRGQMGRGRMEAQGIVTGKRIVGISFRIAGTNVEINDEFRGAMLGIPYKKEKLVELLKADPQWADPVALEWVPTGLEDGPETLDIFNLRGEIDFSVQVERPVGRRGADVVVRAISNGKVSGTFKDLPIPVDDLVGSVVFEKGLAQFAFDGSARGGKVRIEGAVDGRRDEKGAEPDRNGLRVRVMSRSFSLDPTLVPYFSNIMPEVATLLTDTQPSVLCDFEYRGERERNASEGAVDSFIVIQTKSGIVENVPKVGIQLDEFVGSFSVFGRPAPDSGSELDVSIDSIRAKYFGQPVFAQGTFIQKPGTPTTLDLDTNGAKLPLSRKLLFESIRGFSPRAASALQNYDFGGQMDISVNYRSRAQINEVSIDTNIRDGAVSGLALPGNLDQFTGRIQVARPADLRFNEKSIIDLADTSEVNPRFGELAFVVGSEKLTGRINGIDTTLENFLIGSDEATGDVLFSGLSNCAQPVRIFDLLETSRPDLKDWIQQMGFSLSAIPRNLQWEFIIPKEGPLSLGATGTLDVRDGTILQNGVITNINGIAEIDSLTFDANGFRSRVRARNGNIKVFDVPVSEFSGNLEIEPGVFTLREPIAKAAGGLITTGRSGGEPMDKFISIDFSGSEPEWELNFDIENANLTEVFKYAPTANKDVKGSLSLGVLVRGTGAQFRGIKGKGLIRAENTDIV